MSSFRFALVALLACGIGIDHARAASSGTLEPFADEAEFQAYLEELRAAQELERARRARDHLPQITGAFPPMPPAAPPAPSAAPPPGEPSSLDSVQVTGTPVDPDAITNVQTQGVDEGGIVKKHGDYLVVLRRGRLFTLAVGDDGLREVDAVDAYAPDVNPRGTWYDEMLIGDGTIVVIGYSYERGGTEIGLFDLGDDGSIAYRDTYQLRGNDYYSANNYASRLVGDKLVFYTPLHFDAYDLDPAGFTPALRRWRTGATPADFHRILPASRIYRSAAPLDAYDLALHTVSLCDLAAAPMQCESTAVLGPSGRVFYVSQDSVYVWASPWDPQGPDASSVFRIPLDGSAPTGLRTSGSPIDQMSFLQRDGHLNVLLGSMSQGEGMWSKFGNAGDLALLRVPLDAFGDGFGAAPDEAYRLLPPGDGDRYNLHNRFIGDWLVYGGAWRHGSDTQTAHALRYAGDGPIQAIRLGHGLERIDAMGTDAILVGSRGPDLHFTSVRLDDRAGAASVFVQRNAAQGEDRSHGFFYKPESDDAGIAGLPILRHGDGRLSASVLYLRNRALRLGGMGRLDSGTAADIDDGCQASCVDWYGNARPIFIGDRVFALLGYELVEGTVAGERIVERRRVDFTPRAGDGR